VSNNLLAQCVTTVGSGAGPEEMAVGRQWLAKHIPSATNIHAKQVGIEAHTDSKLISLIQFYSFLRSKESGQETEEGI
jgi:hypothetical protein